METMSKIPLYVQSVLWSYDLSKIDVDLHKKLIISQVLNFGTKNATDWLFQIYGEDEIRSIANQIPLGQWDHKSLALWTLLLGIHPTSKQEKVLYAR